MDVARSEKRSGGSGRWKWVAGVVAALLAIVGGAYVAAYFIAGNQVPAKSEVEGVAIGGLTPDEAVAKLETELGPEYTAPLTLLAEDGTKAEIAPEDSGLRVDFQQAVRDSGGGFSWNPMDIYHSLTGGATVDLPVVVDAAQLRSAVEASAPAFKREAVDATLAYEGAEIKRTEAVDAAVLDVDATTAAAEQAYRERRDEVDAILASTPPTITDEMVDKEVKEFAEPAVSGPITIKAGETELVVTPEQIAQSITFTSGAEGITHTIDGAALMEATKESREQMDLGEAEDATYKLEGGNVVVVPAKDGVTMSEEALLTAVQEVITATGEARVAEAGVVDEKAEFTTEEAEKLKPNEVIGEFTTNYPHSGYRNTNIGQAAANMNGTVLMPGETLSFNDVVGERTPENGFTDGYVIEGGVLIKSSGGGVSQAATTAFNAGFFAGFEDVEHKPHSLYFPRYPAGREATVVWGAVDMKFKNNTEYPAIVKSWISKSSPGNKGSITVQIISRPTWDDVTATETQRSNFTSGQDRTINDPNCEPQSPIQGFTATYQRQFWKDGKVAKTEDFEWTYSPGDRIRCA